LYPKKEDANLLWPNKMNIFIFRELPFVNQSDPPRQSFNKGSWNRRKKSNWKHQIVINIFFKDSIKSGVKIVLKKNN